MDLIKKILVAYDGSESSQKAVHLAAILAEGRPAVVTLLAVVETTWDGEGEVPPDVAGRIEIYQALVSHAVATFKDLGCTLDTEVLTGPVTETILSTAKDGAYDLIVLGDKARPTLVEYFLGTTAYNVSRRAPCSVVLAK